MSNGICDCGCGNVDPECYNVTLASTCPTNDTSGQPGCVNNECVYPHWDTSVCNPIKYGTDGICDCGCGGTIDPDCADPSNPTTCTGIEPYCDPATYTCADRWTCDPSWYMNGICDCGCGIPDPDCAQESSSLLSPSCVDPATHEQGICYNKSRCVYPGWDTSDPNCDPQEYGSGGECNCGCGGLVDPDCLRNNRRPKGCGGVSPYCDRATGTCQDEWTCDPAWYNNGVCDCGCGIEDPDCANASASIVSPSCVNPATGEQGVCYNKMCVYPGWNTSDPNCDIGNYGTDGFCNCGCGGLTDPDCADAKNPTTCSGVKPFCNGNNMCEDRWTCDPAWFNDSVCNCGCGFPDEDCKEERSISPQCNGTYCVAGECSVPVGWTCEIKAYTKDACYCGCGAHSPGCDDKNNALSPVNCPGDNDYCTTNDVCARKECGNNIIDTGETCDNNNDTHCVGCECEEGYEFNSTSNFCESSKYH